MQNNSSYITLITPDAPMSPDTHGGTGEVFATSGAHGDACAHDGGAVF